MYKTTLRRLCVAVSIGWKQSDTGWYTQATGGSNVFYTKEAVTDALGTLLSICSRLDREKGREATDSPAGREEIGRRWTDLLVAAESELHCVVRVGGSGQFASHVDDRCVGVNCSKSECLASSSWDQAWMRSSAAADGEQSQSARLPADPSHADIHAPFVLSFASEWHFCARTGAMHTADHRFDCGEVVGATCRGHVVADAASPIATLTADRTGSSLWDWVARHDEALAGDGSAPLDVRNLNQVQTIALSSR